MLALAAGLILLLLGTSESKGACLEYSVEGIVHGKKPGTQVISVVLDGNLFQLTVDGPLEKPEVQKQIDRWMKNLIKENCR